MLGLAMLARIHTLPHLNKVDMEGLFVHREEAENTTLHLLRFYANDYVIYRSITGNKKDYVTKVIRKFSMTGHQVNGEPEFTFCGAYQEYGERLSFKVENELANASDTWAQKDVLSFKGVVKEDQELRLTRTSKRTQQQVEMVFSRTTDEALLNSL